MKKVLVLVLVMAMMLSLAACNKKVIDEDDFEDIMEDLDYIVTEGYPDKKVDESMNAHDEDYEYYVTFQAYDDVDDAKEDFNDSVDDVKDIKEDKEFKGTIKTSKSGNFQKCVIKGDFDEDSDMFDGDVYMVMIRVDNVLIGAYTQSTKAKDVKEIDTIIKKLGY